METDVKEILSAFVDGEAVEASELAAALEAPGAREALLDFVRLRALLEDGAEPSAGFVARMRAELARPVLARVPRVVRLAAAAAVLALAAVGALDLGRRVLPQPTDEPPQATRVIHFQPGVDWVEKAGE